MKHRIGWFLALTASVGLAAAQSPSHQSSSASTKSGPDPLKSSTKPLTPKSAMPVQHKSSPAVPPATGTHTSSELSRLERTNIPASGSKHSDSGAAKAPPIAKSSDNTRSSPPVNFKYQKPTGGMQASTPNARSANSSTPRVKPK